MRILTTAAILAALFLAQPARAADDYPPAFPRAGGTLIMENAWGAAWDAVYAPGQPTPMHRHRFDFVGVELADSAVTVTTPDGQSKTFPAKHGDSYFLPRGVTHVELTPAGDPARHAVLIDLKDGAPAATSSPLASVAAFPGEAARKVVENPRVVLWDYAWPATPPAAPAVYARNTFIVIVDGGELTATGPAGKTATVPVTSGQVLFRPAGSALAEAATKGQVRAIVVELK